MFDRYDQAVYTFYSYTSIYNPRRLPAFYNLPGALPTPHRAYSWSLQQLPALVFSQGCGMAVDAFVPMGLPVRVVTQFLAQRAAAQMTQKFGFN